MGSNGTAREREEADRPDISVAFVLQPGFTILAFSSVVDILRHAADEGDRSRQILCRWAVLGDPERPIASSCGLEVFPRLPLSQIDLDRFDYLVVVGGLIDDGRDIDPAIYHLLVRAHAAGTGIIALCTGFVHLAKAGLLSGRRCCVPWMYTRELAALCASARPVHGVAYIEDAGVFTALGGVAPLILTLDLVTRHCGPGRARKCAERLCLPETLAAGARSSPELEEEKVHGNRHLIRAVEAMRTRVGEPLDMETLAALVGVSSRQLRAVFHEFTGKSPARFLRDMRLREARWRLANKPQTITQIAHATGFSDSAHLTRRFREAFGCTPNAYRRPRQRADRPL